MTTALDNVMNQAAEAAKNFTPPALVQDNLPAPITGAGTSLAKPGAESFTAAGGLDVDDYLKVDKDGLKIGDMKGLLEYVDVELDASEAVYIYSCRGELPGGGIKFIKSYDGVSTPQGQNFQVAAQQMQNTMQKVTGIYSTLEIPMTLLSNVKDPKTAKVWEGGIELGLTPSVTGAKGWRKFLKKLEAAGLANETIEVRVSHKQKTNSSNQDYGVPEFELLSDATAAQAA